MTSYTDMARRRAPVVLPGPTAGAAEMLDHWVNTLPPAQRQAIEHRMLTLAQRLPEADRLRILRELRSRGIQLPAPLGVEELGCLPCAAMLLGCACEEGMGWLAPLAQAVASVGTGVWSTLEQKDLQKDLAQMSVASQEKIAQIQADAAIEAQRLLATAQIETARQAKEGIIGMSATGAPIYKQVAIGGVVLAAVGLSIGGYFLLRKKKGR